MKLKAVVHEAEEGGFWAEVPAIPGCCTQGETFEQLLEHSRKLWKAVFRSTLLPSRPVSVIGSWKAQYEVPIRARPRQGGRA